MGSFAGIAPRPQSLAGAAEALAVGNRPWREEPPAQHLSDVLLYNGLDRLFPFSLKDGV